MGDVFISHIEKDGDVALEIARGLEAAGYTTWYYERDSQVGSLYLLQVGQAIERCRAVVLIISSDSIASNQVTNEVVRAYESDKPFLPVLRDITHPQFQQRQTLWRQALGATVAINLPPEGVPAILPRLMDGLRALGIQPKSKEEREAEARQQERAKEVVGLLTKAGEAQSAEKWGEAIALLKEALELAPNDETVQGKLRGVQEQQRESQLNALMARARSLAEGEEWEEALSTWREVLALEPEDREEAEARIQQVEQSREMAHAYAQAQAAMANKDYDQATGLLQGLVVQDPSYKDAARLLAKAVELRRIGGRPKPSRWLWGAVATVAIIAIIAVALAVTQVLPRLARSGQETAVLPTEAVADATAVEPAPDDTPMLSETDAATATSQVESAATATSTPSSQESKPESATATHTLAPTAPVTAESPTVSTAASPIPPDDTASQSILVPDEVVGQFFSPGPSPAALAVVGDVLWVINDEPRMLHQLDRTGTPLASFPITPTDTIRGLVWDGENLRLALRRQILRLDTDGTVLAGLSVPVELHGLGWDPAGSTLWTHSNEFLLEFGADGRLLQTLYAPVTAWAGGLTWAPDGLWVVDVHGYWHLFGLDGEKWRRFTSQVVGLYGSELALSWDELSYLWLTVPNDRRVYQLSLRQSEVQPRPTSATAEGKEHKLPRPQLKPASTTDTSLIHIVNSLQGTVSLSFGDESAILKPGETWSTELPEGVYTAFASASQPEPIAFSDKQLLVAGYDWTWVLDRPE